jgi:hypothetical protein
MEEDGKVVVCLDAARLQVLGDKEGSLFEKEKGFSHAWMGHSGDEVCVAHGYMGAFCDNGLPAREDAAPVVALLLGNNHIAGPRALDCSDGRASPPEDAVPFVATLVGNGRATDQGVYYHDVLLPPENVVVPAAEALRAPRPATYAVQVSWACALFEAPRILWFGFSGPELSVLTPDRAHLTCERTRRFGSTRPRAARPGIRLRSV